MNANDRLISPSKVALMLGIATRQVVKLIRDGKLAAKRQPCIIGHGGRSTYKVLESTVRQYIEDMPDVTVNEPSVRPSRRPSLAGVRRYVEE